MNRPTRTVTPMTRPTPTIHTLARRWKTAQRVSRYAVPRYAPSTGSLLTAGLHKGSY